MISCAALMEAPIANVGHGRRNIKKSLLAEIELRFERFFFGRLNAETLFQEIEVAADGESG
jgi:hypothetical protein